MYFIWNYIVIIFAYTCLKVETLEQQVFIGNKEVTT